jgi:hypothetical protein
MAATKIGVIYDRYTLEIRRIIVPDHDNQLPLHVGKGEALTTMPMTGVYPAGRSSIARAREAVIRATGRIPPN